MAEPVDGRYQVHRKLGEGASGRVWLVEDTLRPGSRLALKELSQAPGGTRHEEALRREFATLACLRHPNLVEVHEFDGSHASGRPRFTLEFIEGRDIVTAVDHEGPGLLMDLTAESLRALAFLHDFDLIHGDLKPANVLVRDRPKLDCRLVLVDFGFARGPADDDIDIHNARGTLPYMAPEVLRNERPGPASDLYALGAVLHHAVLGKPPIPFEGGDLARFIDAVVEGRRSRPPLAEGYPEGLARWLGEMLAPDVADRLSSGDEALARLNEACGTEYSAHTRTTRAARLLSGPPAERLPAIAEIRGHLDPDSGPRVVWLCGGPGSGKTRILRWLEAECVRDGWSVVSSSVDSRLTLDELRARADEGPTLLMVDEADHASAAMVELLERVARERDRPPVQVVASLRPGAFTRPALRKLFSDTGTVPSLRKVELGPLDADGIRALARRVTGAAVSEERVQWLVEASEGSPAAAESLLIDGGWERGERPPAPGKTGLAEGRLEMLSPAARAWIDALAVLGAGAREDQLGEITASPPAEARVAAAEASAAGLAFRKGNRWHPESRALLEHLRSLMSEEHRRELFAGAAELLESSPDPETDPWILSRLWSGAGKPQLAVAYAIRAAERSEASRDPAEAASRYADALRLIGRDRTRRREIRERQADALVDAGLYAPAARAYGALLRLCSTDAERASAQSKQAHALIQAGRFELGSRTADRAARLARTLDDAESLARAQKAAGIALGRLGRETEAISLLESAREILRRGGDTEGEAEIVQVLGSCRLRLGSERAEADFEEALRLHRRAASTREPGAATSQELKARIGLAVIRARARRYDEASTLLGEVRDQAVAKGDLALQEVALSKLAVVAIDRGELDRAIDLAESAADLARHLGDPNLVLVNHARLADARIRCGRPGEAVVLLRETLERPLARVEPENVDYARMILAEAWMESGRGEPSTVARLLDEALQRCRTRDKRRPLMVALVLEMERRSRPDCPDAFEPVSLELDGVVESLDDPVDPEIEIRAELARAAFQLHRGDPTAARGAASRAATTAGRVAAHAFEARARALLAEAFGRLDRGGSAREQLQEGRRLLEESAARIRDEEVRRTYLARPAFAALRGEEALARGSGETRLGALYDMIRALNSETDPDALLESILDMALRAVGAERGMILLGTAGDEGGAGEPAVHLARNLERETIRDAESYSRQVVAAAGAGTAMLVLDTGDDERVRNLRSVSLYGIRSLMCVPLRSRGRIIGTVYLDSRLDGALFTPDDLRFLEAFADHAALALENTRDRARLEADNRRLQAEAETRTEFGNIVGRCRAMQAVFDLVERVADTELPVLIHGESGTGKELVARAVHYRGPRRRKRFVAANCAAIPENLLESELFGHVRGAFTGAERDRRGLFEQAHEGTLFLDEVGDMAPAMQARLLRVLEEGRVRRVGGESSIEVDVRVLAATHRDLRDEVSHGRFREDLMYRLRVLTLEIPPLRERPGDVDLLVRHFLERFAGERGRERRRVDDDVVAALEAHAWPGNVRELENTLRHLEVLAGDGPITRAVVEFDPALARTFLGGAADGAPELSLETGERDQILRAIEAAGGNRSKAAGLLGVSRATLYRKIRRHGL